LHRSQKDILELSSFFENSWNPLDGGLSITLARIREWDAQQTAAGGDENRFGWVGPKKVENAMSNHEMHKRGIGLSSGSQKSLFFCG
jgi:hypothetical protein